MELKLAGITFKQRERTVLDGLTATVPGAGLTCLIGANGAGKTTLLRILTGELKPASGSYLLGGTDAATLSRAGLAGYFSVIPQNAPIPPYLTVEEMVSLGCFRPRAALGRRLSPADRAAVAESLAACGLNAFKERRLEELSGGEQRRAWLAFGLVPAKPFLMLDETLDGLDLPAKRSFFRLLKAAASSERSILMASHDLELVGKFADKVIVMQAGRVVFEGAPSGDLARFFPEN